MSPIPYPYQQFGSEWLANRDVAILADEMGLGKSAQAARGADIIKAKNILTVAPAIALPMWEREFLTWQQIPRSIQIIRSSADAQHLHGDVVIVSYSLLPKILSALRRRRFDLLIADEAQALKNVDAARTRAVYGKGGVIEIVPRIWLLSGTLAPNHPGELWTHLRALFGEKASYQDFIECFCRVRKTPFGQQIVGANLDRTAALAYLIRPHQLRRRQQDVLAELPELRWSHFPVTPDEVPPKPDLTIEEAAILDKLERGEAFSVTESMALATFRRWTGIAKAPAVVELIRSELEGGLEKTVVFAIHTEVIATLAAGLGADASVIDGRTPQATRQKLIDAFQNEVTPRVLILQLNAAGTALTLTRATRVVFAECSWTPADLAQAAARCHRIGQAKSVLATVVSLVGSTVGSIDEAVNQIIARKAEELTALEAAIQENAA